MELENFYNQWTTAGNTAYGMTGTYCYPSNWTYTYTYDKGEKALNVLKALRAKKLVKIETIDQFIEAMSLIMKEL